MTFDPTEHFIYLQKKAYLPVQWRLVWFREDHPLWAIQTELVEHDPVAGLAVVKAHVFGDKTGVIATGHKMETRKGFADYMEKAETGAIGRALAVLGYGTQFAQELDEGEGEVVDSPQPPKPQPKREPEVPLVTVDDLIYKHYQALCAEAKALGVDYEEVQPPLPKQMLIDIGKELKDAVGIAKAKAPVAR